MKETILLFLFTSVILVFFVTIMTWRAKRYPKHSGCGCQHHHSEGGCQCGNSEPSKVEILEQMPPDTH